MKNNNRDILIFKDIDRVSNYAIEKWMEFSEKAIQYRGRFTVALSGGETPVTLYKKLAGFQDALPWYKTHIFLVDERFVSYNHKESNFNMIKKTFLNHVDIPDKNIHPVPILGGNPQNSANKYQKKIMTFFKLPEGEFPEFDLVLLGMGEDGHTASLFPDTPSLQETERLAVAVSLSRISAQDRITITFPVINNADNVIFLISGSKKASIVHEILQKGNSALPASMVKPKKGKLLFLLDEEAGSLLFKKTLTH